MWAVFSAEYLQPDEPLRLNAVHTSSAAGEQDVLHVGLYIDGERTELDGRGNGPIAAFVDALERSLGLSVDVIDYAEHALSAGHEASAAAYVELTDGHRAVRWGVGIDKSISSAGLKAVVSAINHQRSKH